MTLQVIVGGQYGSEGKGAIAAYLAAEQDSLLALRVAGPNAGHTVIGRCPPECPDGVPPDHAVTSGTIAGRHLASAHPWRLRHVPVAAVTNPDAQLALAPGSEIDPDVITQEILSLDAAGYKVSSRMAVDETATLIDPVHQDIEAHWSSPNIPGSLVDRIGSTGKGVGAARAARAMRDARLAADYDWADSLFELIDVGKYARYKLNHGNVQVEGTQGYLLGQHAGYYPQCTSSDCTAIDFLSMAGVPPWLVHPSQLEVWVVFRTYPIRVAGNSGPLAGETSWGALGQTPEYTTVTRRVRRVGTWDQYSAQRAMEANGRRPGPSNPVRAALTMADYVVPALAGVSDLTGVANHNVDLLDQLVAARSKDLGALVELIGTGPSSVIDARRDSTGTARHLAERMMQ